MAMLVMTALSAVLLMLSGMWLSSPLDDTILVTVVGGFLLFSASVVVTLVLCRAIANTIGHRPREQALKFLLLLLIVLSLFSLTINYNPTQPSAEYPSAPAIQFLRADGSIYRVLSSDLVLPPDSNLEYALFGVRGYSAGLVPNPFSSLEERVGSVTLMTDVQFFNSYTSPALDLMNVKYVMADNSLQLPPPRFKPVYSDSAVTIFQNTNCLPRAFIVYNYTVTTNETQALVMVADGQFNYTSTVMLGPLKPDEQTPLVMKGAGNASIASYEPNSVTVKVVTSSPGLLFLSDSYYPGWNAYLDGVKVHIYRADYAFRAVSVPSGAHTVQFLYEPPSFYNGIIISAASALLLFGCIVLNVGRRRIWPYRPNQKRR
jgi:hypothetical protein